MKHVYFLYFIITFLAGVISLTMGIVAYRKAKNAFLRYYFYFYIPFTLLVVLNTFLVYIRSNIPMFNPTMFEIFDYFESSIAIYLVMLTVPIFIHHLFSIPLAPRRDVIVAGLTGILFSAHHLFDLIAHDNRQLRFFGEFLVDVIFFAVMVYSLGIGIYYTNKGAAHNEQGFSKRFLLLFGLFLPGLINDTFFSESSPIRLFPLLYCGLSVLFTLHFLQHYIFHQSEETSPNSATQHFSYEKLFQHYNISLREQDIIHLLLQGYRYQEIAEELYISVNTVKTHVRNIYPKFGVKSRYELMTLLKHPHDTSHDLLQSM